MVKTTHVLILRDVVAVDDDSRIHSLMYNLNSLNIEVIGGAVKNINNGYWDMGCYQMAHRNYVLVYKSGYRHSKNSCVFCHDITGPFIAKTSLMKNYNFSGVNLPEELIFHDFFFNQFKKSIKICCLPRQHVFDQNKNRSKKQMAVVTLCSEEQYPSNSHS